MFIKALFLFLTCCAILEVESSDKEITVINLDYPDISAYSTVFFVRKGSNTIEVVKRVEDLDTLVPEELYSCNMEKGVNFNNDEKVKLQIRKVKKSKNKVYTQLQLQYINRFRYHIVPLAIYSRFESIPHDEQNNDFITVDTQLYIKEDSTVSEFTVAIVSISSQRWVKAKDIHVHTHSMSLTCDNTNNVMTVTLTTDPAYKYSTKNLDKGYNSILIGEEKYTRIEELCNTKTT